MRKKKLLSKISELESENASRKYNEEFWRDKFIWIFKELNRHGVKAEIIFPKAPMIDCTLPEDDVTNYMSGMTTEPPTLRFDFTEHDKRVMKNAINQ